ncbi:GtrA family protein [Patescibacteria group bacterium]|nr:MAG: GtrA family protein [Patescibacteria group bacterium]
MPHPISIPLFFRQAAAYAAVGFFSMLADVFFFGWLTFGLKVHYLAANLFSFIVIGSLNFLANRRFTFNHRGVPGVSQYLKFFAVVGIGLLLNTALLAFFVEIISLHKILAKLFAAAVTFFWNFGMNRFWTFAAAPRRAEQEIV